MFYAKVTTIETNDTKIETLMNNIKGLEKTEETLILQIEEDDQIVGRPIQKIYRKENFKFIKIRTYLASTGQFIQEYSLSSVIAL